MRLVQGDGPYNSRFMFIGERPGHEELRTGRVFVGKAGDEYGKLLWRYGFNRSEVRTDNILADQATGDKGTVCQADIERNRERLYAEIDKTRPEVIITMGAVPTKFFLSNAAMDDGDVRCDIHTVHGIPHPFGQIKQTIFPTFNPAAGLHDPDNYQYIHYDFKMLQAYVNGRVKIDRQDKYPDICYAHVESDIKRALVQDKPQLISIDTEGHLPIPWGLSVSWGDGMGWVLRSPESIAVLREYIGNHRPDTLLHYAVHDLPILKYGWGIDLIGSGCKVIDTMVLAYLLQIEPQGLKNLCYRHCGMLMQDYIDLVGPYSLDKQVDYLLKVMQDDWGTPDPVVEEGKLESKVTQPQGLNRRIESILNDIALDKKPNVWKRWRDIYPQVREECEAKYGGLPSASLDDIPLDKAIYYSGRDADGTYRLYPRLLHRIKELGLEEVMEVDLGVVDLIDEMQQTRFKVDILYFRKLLSEFRSEQGKMRYQIRELVGRGINPESPPDVRWLFFKKLHLPILKRSKITREASTGEKAVESLRGTHPAVDLTLDHRELDKMCSSFIIPALRVAEEQESKGEESSIGGKINYTRVVSGRLSMSKENDEGEIVGMNLLAIPVRNQIGKRIRNGFIARDGCYLGSWDLNQIEMRFMAHESQDPFLMEAYNEGKDIHKATAASAFGIREDQVTPEQRYGAKRTGFSVITGITPVGLLDVFRKEGITTYTEDDCRNFIEGWLDRCKGVRAYLSQCRSEAKRYGYVRESISGRMRYLPGVWSMDDRIREEALRQSHSHKISAGAQIIMKRIMANLKSVIRQLQEDGEYVRWILQIHDEIILEFRQGLEVILDPIIRDIMATTVELRVPVKGDGHWGVRWGEIKD